MELRNSALLHDRAQKVIPGGVNSPVRAFKGVGGVPRTIASARGAYITDVDNQTYVDFVCSWGAIILGHSDSLVQRAVSSVAAKGLSFGAPTEAELLFAEKLCSRVPGLEMVRLVNSGTEATMSAIRLARAYKGREIVIKFNGCYHGHADSFLVSAGSGLATFGISSCPGVPQSLAALTLSLEYNDIDALIRTLNSVGPENVAAIILEVIAGNMGMIMPNPEFISSIKDLCSRYGIVLIADEVMSGFRASSVGASPLFMLEPDLITLGKVIGGGLPLAAFGGKREIMELLAPLGPVYQAGTLSGNPLAVAAGTAVIDELERTDPYDYLGHLTSILCAGLLDLFSEHGIPFCYNNSGGMFGFFFSEGPIYSYEQILRNRSVVEIYKRFFHAMLDRGVYFAPSAFEAGFLTVAHTENDIGLVLECARQSIKENAVF